MNIYKNVGVFMPIVVDVNEQGVFVGFTNEATFASNISQEMGILTNETLLNYQNFQFQPNLLLHPLHPLRTGSNPTERILND
jgi:hypothetical protein